MLKLELVFLSLALKNFGMVLLCWVVPLIPTTQLMYVLMHVCLRLPGLRSFVAVCPST